MPGIGLFLRPLDFCHRPVQRNQTCNRPRFVYLTKTKCHPFYESIYSRFDINCFYKLSNATAACGWIQLCTSCLHFHIIWLCNGQYYSRHNAFSPTVILGQNGTYYAGAKWHWGAKWNGTKWHHSILPLKVFHFVPMPLFGLPHTHSTFDNFSDESD